MMSSFTHEVLNSNTLRSFAAFCLRMRQPFFITLFCLLVIYLFACLLSYSPTDVAWSHSVGSNTQNLDDSIKNIGGISGAWLSDILFLFFGVGAWASMLWAAHEAYVAYRERTLLSAPWRVLAYALLWVGLSMVLHGAFLLIDSADHWGGIVGQVCFTALADLISDAGAMVLSLVAFAFIGYLLIDLRPHPPKDIYTPDIKPHNGQDDSATESASATDTPAYVPHEHHGALESFLIHSGLRGDLSTQGNNPQTDTPQSLANATPSSTAKATTQDNVAPRHQLSSTTHSTAAITQPTVQASDSFSQHSSQPVHDTHAHINTVPNDAHMDLGEFIQTAQTMPTAQIAQAAPAQAQTTHSDKAAFLGIDLSTVSAPALTETLSAPVHGEYAPAPTAPVAETGADIFAFVDGIALNSTADSDFDKTLTAVTADMDSMVAMDTSATPSASDIGIASAAHATNAPHSHNTTPEINTAAPERDSLVTAPLMNTLGVVDVVGTTDTAVPSVQTAHIDILNANAPHTNPAAANTTAENTPSFEPSSAPANTAFVNDTFINDTADTLQTDIAQASITQVDDIAQPNSASADTATSVMSETHNIAKPDINDDALNAAKSFAMQTAAYRASLSPLPELSLLDPAPSEQINYSPLQLQRLSELLEIKLKEFGVNAQVMDVMQGPVVTSFEVELAAGVKVSKVTGIAKDLARSLSMGSLRVVEVIEGKPYIGIEIPNQRKQMVKLIELLEDPSYQDNGIRLAMAMGKDIAGRAIITDLAETPHILVAGTTGSGKSVLVNAMLLSMLLKCTPEELRLILIDPKMLELANYSDIPHLLTPVVTDMTEAASALSWCVGEMERRYHLMSLLRVRGLDSLNKLIAQQAQAGQPILDPLWRPNDSVSVTSAPKLQPLPFIVVVADEFADLIMQVGKQAEELITRLAQKSRAAGIHLILATQRPSVDVVTGLIKANVPSRVALRVNSKVDSRTILDTGGAEDMLGHGDMLFIPPRKNEPMRVHGAYVTDNEVNRICDAWRERGRPNYVEAVNTTSFGDDAAPRTGTRTGSGEDTLYDEAVALVIAEGKVSTSWLQRKLEIGYNRAAKIVENMEAQGVISPPDRNNKRTVISH